MVASQLNNRKLGLLIQGWHYMQWMCVYMHLRILDVDQCKFPGRCTQPPGPQLGNLDQTWRCFLGFTIHLSVIQVALVDSWWYTQFWPDLVGGFNHLEKYESQLGWVFPIYGKIKNVPNHQPVSYSVILPPQVGICIARRLQLRFYFTRATNLDPCSTPEPGSKSIKIG